MRARAIAAASVLLGSSCAQVASETRRERGPLIRSFERRAAKEPAGLRAEVRAQWPTLELRILSSSVCRTEAVREYSEEVITERSSKAAGPSIALGVTATAAGAALLLLRESFSSTPDYSVIDGGGRYGASQRQYAIGWGIALAAVGLPSILAGAVGLAQSGESTGTRMVDQVMDSNESRCDEKPANGKLAVIGPRGPQEGRATQDGVVTLPPEALRGTVVGLALDGQAVLLDSEDEETLQAFRACARVLPMPDDAALGQASTPELILRLEEAQRCALIAGSGGAQAATRLADALAARAAPVSRTMDEATAALPPEVTLAPGSADLQKLWRRAIPDGTAARLSGEVVRGEGPNLVLVQVGAQDVHVELDGTWPEPGPRRGQKVDVVGVLVGIRAVGEVEAPVLRATFVRITP
ncbi:MAG TPA: hypothetical protein VIG99_05020 [Myxococcaceae bacterium]